MTTDRIPYRFRLIDLLLLMGVIGLGLAMIVMMLPTIHGPGGHNYQGHCINNQRQIALGIIGYATRKGTLPGYQRSINGICLPWPATIMRDIGRGDIADVLAAPNLQRNDPAFDNRINVLICPSDPPDDASAPSLSYALNAGLADPADNNPANGIGLNHCGETGTTDLSYVTQRDGTSNTILLSENVQATLWNRPGKVDTVIVWHATTKPKPEQLINQGMDLPLNANTARPSSRHRGSVVIAFCDGTARYVNEKIDYSVYVQLMTPDSAESSMPKEWKKLKIDANTLESQVSNFAGKLE